MLPPLPRLGELGLVVQPEVAWQVSTSGECLKVEQAFAALASNPIFAANPACLGNFLQSLAAGSSGAAGAVAAPPTQAVEPTRPAEPPASESEERAVAARKQFWAKYKTDPSQLAARAEHGGPGSQKVAESTDAVASQMEAEAVTADPEPVPTDTALTDTVAEQCPEAVAPALSDPKPVVDLDTQVTEKTDADETLPMEVDTITKDLEKVVIAVQEAEKAETQRLLSLPTLRFGEPDDEPDAQPKDVPEAVLPDTQLVAADSLPDAQPRDVPDSLPEVKDSLPDAQPQVRDVPESLPDGKPQDSQQPAQVAVGQVPGVGQAVGTDGSAAVSETLRRLSTVDLTNGCRPPQSLVAPSSSCQNSSSDERRRRAPAGHGSS